MMSFTSSPAFENQQLASLLTGIIKSATPPTSSPTSILKQRWPTLFSLPSLPLQPAQSPFPPPPTVIPPPTPVTIRTCSTEYQRCMWDAEDSYRRCLSAIDDNYFPPEGGTRKERRALCLEIFNNSAGSVTIEENGHTVWDLGYCRMYYDNCMGLPSHPFLPPPLPDTA